MMYLKFQVTGQLEYHLVGGCILAFEKKTLSFCASSVAVEKVIGQAGNMLQADRSQWSHYKNYNHLT